MHFLQEAVLHVPNVGSDVWLAMRPHIVRIVLISGISIVLGLVPCVLIHA